METIDGYDYLCMHFVHSCVLLLMVFLVWYIMDVGGVGCVYYSLGVDWVSLCFEFVCQLVYVCVCLVIFVCFVLFYILCIFVVGYVSSAPNEHIMRLSCMGGEVTYTLLYTFYSKFFQFLYSFSWLWRLLCLFD